MAIPLTLHYDQAARTWVEALPIGNGRQGAMIFGGVAQEHIQFNEDTVWTGKPHDYTHLEAYKSYPKLCEMTAEMLSLERAGKWEEAKNVQQEAEQLASKNFMSIPLGQKTYQPVGDLHIRFPDHKEISNYTRSLSLDDALSKISYSSNAVTYTREAFASFPDQVLVIKLSSSKANALNCTLNLSSPHKSSSVSLLDNSGLLLSGEVEKDGIRFATLVSVQLNDGELVPEDNQLNIQNASEVIITLTSASNFVSYKDISADPVARCRAVMNKLASLSYVELKERHLHDYQTLFNRVQLELSDTSPTTDTLARLLAEDKTQDPQLYALYFQYGRYLLIASSRAKSQPANLQGIWNHLLEPAWDSKWTTNINLEMNYWPAEITNLADCHSPLFDLLDDLRVTGQKVAQEHYGAQGWVLHHNSDLWRGAAPINSSDHGIWQTGGAWLCQHLWWHYIFNLDEEFLRDRAYPIMREACLFFSDLLALDETTGWLISPLSNSPELGGLVAAPSMDHQIIRELFSNTIKASEILGVSEDLREALRKQHAQIAPNQIGKYGQLQEWLSDKDDPNEKHRHVSHLWALYPGTEITKETPELFEAAKQSLVFRGDAGTGWSMGWKINFWARFKDGNHALTMLNQQLKLVDREDTHYDGEGGTYPNLFDAHPPFQIDGNFGATAGIAEMLMQSHAGYIELLPALPDSWSTGSLRGLRARGGFEIALTWSNNKLTQLQLNSSSTTTCTLRYKDKTISLETQKGSTYTFNRKLERLA